MPINEKPKTEDAVRVQMALRAWDDLERVHRAQSVRDVIEDSQRERDAIACQYGQPGCDSCFDCPCAECVEQSEAAYSEAYPEG